MPEIEQVLMLTNAIAPDQLGGLERYVRELSAALVRKGMPVTVLAKRTSVGDAVDNVSDDGVRIIRHRVPAKDHRTFAVQYPLYVAAGVLREVRRQGTRTLVHGHYPITTLPMELSRRPYLYTYHSPVHQEVLAERNDSYALPRSTQRIAVQGMRTVERRTISRAYRTVVLSNYMRRELEVLSAASTDRSRVIAGGIDTTWFSPGPSHRDDWAQAAAPLIVTARRLTDRTGVLELVRAMPQVLARWPTARLAVAGEGHDRAVIEDEVRTLGVGTEVRLLGRLYDEEMLRWYRMADLTVTPTQRLEGFGLATGESLAVGTPALVTPIGANAELVRDLHPLLVAAGRRPVDLSEAICRLLDQPGLLEKLRTKARSHAHPRWSWERVAEAYLELYRERSTP